MKPSYLLFSTILLATACDSARETRELKRQVGDLTKTLTDYLGESPTTQEALAELKKLQQYEYKVLSLPADMSPAAIESALNEFGKERWDCFHAEKRVHQAEPARSELAFFCKRRPETPLRFFPHQVL